MKRLVLIVTVVISLVILAYPTKDSPTQEYTGICVKSGESYSILFNGSSTILVLEKLDQGVIYTVKGHFKEGKHGKRITPESIKTGGNLKLTKIRGIYWTERGQWYVFVRWRKIRLSKPLNLTDGMGTEVTGIRYNGVFYPVDILESWRVVKPVDGAPWRFRGVVLSSRIVWNGSDRIAVYPPYGLELEPGRRVEVLGIVRIGTEVTVYAKEVRTLGLAVEVPLADSGVGEIGTGKCRVLKGGRGLKLNCTNLTLYGFRARTDDVISLRALNRGRSLICVQCTVVIKREEMPNGICSWNERAVGKIGGKVAWVRYYKNGFGIANVTEGNCSVLLKISKSLDFHPAKGDVITAYGTFTRYRGLKALQPSTVGDVCYGRC